MTGLPTRAFLQTRGTARASDYAFLGAAPSEPWWRAYRDATAFDHPTVLVTSDGERWAAYLSGIPSARMDAVGSVVRYTLVLDGPRGAAESACVVAAVASWVDDAATGRPGALAAALDAAFPAELVDRMLGRPYPGVVDTAARFGTDASIVHGHVLEALATLPVPPPTTDVPGSWAGGVASPQSRAAFRARTGLLLAGMPGRALLLNLLGGADDAAVLLDPASPVAVLVEGADPPATQPAQPVVEAKKAPAPPSRAGVAVLGIALVPLVAMVGVLALTALVVTLLVWLL